MINRTHLQCVLDVFVMSTPITMPSPYAGRQLCQQTDLIIRSRLPYAYQTQLKKGNCIELHSI